MRPQCIHDFVSTTVTDYNWFLLLICTLHSTGWMLHTSLVGCWADSLGLDPHRTLFPHLSKF